MPDDAPNGPLSFAAAYRKRQEALAEEARNAPAPTRAQLRREQFWRSSDPITIDRWRVAREAKGYGIRAFAATLGMDPHHAVAIERGTEQPTEQEQHNAGRLTGMLPRWFHLPPMEPFGPTSMDWHQDWRVCDLCEREYPGGHIPPKDERYYEAEAVCADCGSDYCGAHGWTEKAADGTHTDRCEDCHRNRTRAANAQARAERARSQQQP